MLELIIISYVLLFDKFFRDSDSLLYMKFGQLFSQVDLDESVDKMKEILSFAW